MGSSRYRTRWAFAAAASLGASGLGAQPPREVHGTISHVTRTGARPLAGAWVTLHRVGTDRAGPVDSVRAGGDGGYAFRFRVSGDTGALYFVSSRFAGIAYFTPALKQAVIAGSDADLAMYDTTSAAVPIHVRGRHIVVMAPDSARSRRAVEVFELSNDSTITRVSGAHDRPTWEAALPDGARDVRAGEGEITGGAMVFTAGRVRVFAPIAPGVKQLSFSYRLPVSREPVVFPSFAPAAVLEVLLEDEKGTVSGGSLRETEPATLERRRFRRFLAQDAPGVGAVTITAPTASSLGTFDPRILLIVTAVGATLLLGLAAGTLRRRPERQRARRAETDDPDALGREIAALETAFGALASPSADERADHYEARARLAARLTAALARREGLA